MATLTSTKIKNTYDALLKSIDNDAIGTTAKQITDGLGNVTPLYVSTTQVGIGVTPESGLNLHVFGDAKIGSNLTVIGNLVVEGSTTTVGTDTLTVKDPLIVLANNNTSTDAVDIGFYGKYHPSGTTLYSGLFREALTGKYRLFKGLEVEPTTTVNTSGTGYAQATLIAALEGDVTGNVTGNLTGNVTGGTISGTTGDFSGNVDIDGTLDVDDVISVEGSAFGRIEIGGASGGYIDLKAPNSDDYDFRIITSSGGNEITTATGDLIFNTAETLALTIDTSQDATFAGSVVASTNLQAQVESNGVSLRLVTGGLISWMTNGSDQYNTMSISGNNNTGLMTFRTNGDDALVIDASQNVNPKEDLRILDNKKATFGNDNDLEIYHDGSNGFIKNTTGQLNITDSIIALRNQADNENMLYARENAQVELYYDNSIKLATTNTGITVTGDVDFTGNINIGDNQKILFGDGGDIEMFFNGSTFVIDDTVEVFGFDIDTNLIRFRGTDLYTEISNGQHTFWTNGTERFKINATEVKVSHQLNVTGDLIVDTDTLFVDVSEDSVGIGLTNPSDYSADELVISVPDTSGMTLVSGTTDTAYIRFADGTAAADQANFISHDHNTNTLTIFSQAKVSIGILEAEVAYFTDTAFFVDKSTTIDDTLTVNGNVEIADSDNTLLYLNSSTANVYLRLDDSGSTNGNFIGATSNDMHFWTNNTERMRIDSSGNVGIGTASPDAKLDISNVAGATYALEISTPERNRALFFYNSASVSDAGYLGIKRGSVDALNHRFATTGNSAVCIGEGNFGIGTDSPTAKLDIRNGELTVRPSSSGNGGLGKIGHSSNNAILQLYDSSGTEDVRISTSLSSYFNGGNVGIGTGSPSSDISGSVTMLEINDATNNNLASLALKAGTQGSKWEIAAQSSNALGFFDDGSERMRIDSSGNVGIGTDSPATKLHVVGTIKLGGYSYIGEDLSDQDSLTIASDHTEAIHFAHFTPATGTYSTNMIIDSSGNVGIGTASPQQLLHISNTSGDFGAEAVLRGSTSTGTPKSEIAFKRGSSGDGAEMVLRTSNSSGTIQDVMTLDTSGEIQVGNAVGGSDTDTGTRINATQMRQSSSGTGAHDFHDFYRGTEGSLVRVGNIRTTGTTTAYNTSSDYRLKENVVEITGALDRVSQLKPSRFNFIADADKTVDGFLAHEVQEIVPEAITGEKDAMRDEEYEVTPAVYENIVHPAEEAVYETIEHSAIEEELDDEGNVIVEGKEAYTEEVLVTEAKEEWTEKVLVSEKVMGTREVPDYQGIDQSKLVPLLVGAIQELKAEIESLKSQINN